MSILVGSGKNNANGHERPSTGDFSRCPGTDSEIHCDVKVNQHTFGIVFFRRVRNDDIAGRDILMKNIRVLKKRSVSFGSIAEGLKQLQPAFEVKRNDTPNAFVLDQLEHILLWPITGDQAPFELDDVLPCT
ncbi:unnamed protein product [Periconia digitata]|uniref:Uncharacterized protein n=1 Tax=Periconia digitata TaxID=1303443 RepID=A0A9W4XKM8_9PLEO|nr:unnamed protein product [Periconia digitata]